VPGQGSRAVSAIIAAEQVRKKGGSVGFWNRYFDAVTRIMEGVGAGSGGAAGAALGNLVAQLLAPPRSAPSIDPIRRLDVAKHHLMGAAQAVDRLKQQYERQRDRLDAVMTEIRRREDQFQDTVAKEETARRVLAEDQSRLQEILGITALQATRKGRVVGFVGGVMASLVATALWVVGAWLWASWRR
jgi:hypothetical protein